MSSFNLRKCLYAHICICLCGRSHMYSQRACVRVCVFFILSTPCHLAPSLCSSPPSLFAVQLGEAGLESKVQVCRLADESQRGSFSLTVCKYVVTLIERSFSSQQLSFLLFLCVCVSEHNHSWSSRRCMTTTHRCTKITHSPDTEKSTIIHTHTQDPVAIVRRGM